MLMQRLRKYINCIKCNEYGLCWIFYFEKLILKKKSTWLVASILKDAVIVHVRSDTFNKVKGIFKNTLFSTASAWSHGVGNRRRRRRRWRPASVFWRRWASSISCWTERRARWRWRWPRRWCRRAFRPPSSRRAPPIRAPSGGVAAPSPSTSPTSRPPASSRKSRVPR